MGGPVDLHPRAAALRDLERGCRLCPRACGARRDQGDVGVCGGGSSARVAAVQAHHGEEDCLRGSGGSGTLFLAGCNLGCVYCQNWDISHRRQGEPWSARALADAMLDLEHRGCHNVNWVTPTHAVAALVEGLALARAEGLALPVVYNSSGYDALDTLRLLEGVVDIYMPDLKFLDAAAAARYLTVPDYPQVAQAAIVEMQRQVGDLILDTRRLAVSGLLVRHLVMPGFAPDARAILTWLHDHVSPNTWVNVMGQYHPAGQAPRTGPLADRPTPTEVAQARDHARGLGLRLDR